MKIEERKAVRREAALRPPTKQREDSELTPRGGEKTPRPGSPSKNNKDLSAHLSD